MVMRDIIAYFVKFLCDSPPLKIGNQFLIVNYIWISILVCVFCIVALVIKMSKSGATTLADIRAKAITKPVKTPPTEQEDMHRELREIRIKVELLREEIKALRADLQNPPRYSAYPSAPKMTGQSLAVYPLPENAFH